MPRAEIGTAITVEPAKQVAGELAVPGDKSIAHRALLLAALAQGDSLIRGLPDGEDVGATVACLRGLGARLQRSSGAARIAGAGLRSFATPHGILDCANSGTTMRLLLGVLAGSWVSATLDGDASLRRRPMARVIEPLKSMGARIESHDGRAPLAVTGTSLQGRRLVLAVPSAQVKSALLLAGLSASGPTTVVEPVATRDHTERLLRAMGTDVAAADGSVVIRPSHQPLRPVELIVPGDFSSAAFWMAAAALRPGWSVTIRDVGLNPTRTRFLDLLGSTGAEVRVEGIDDPEIESRGVVTVTGRGLRAIVLGAADVAGAIDEIPVLLALATQADGVTVIEGAGELRVKESDRIATMADGLRRMGAAVDERPDGVSVRGPAKLRGATVESHGDHRIAMALAIAGLTASGPTRIDAADCVAVSYPNFFADLRTISGTISLPRHGGGSGWGL
jgi:3-phosphoshikimate 1-carboxyvinyltransferase